MKRLSIGAGLVVGLAVVIGAVVVGANLLRADPEEPVLLERPAAGQVRADHLADGTPIWVIGHEDGSVDVLSGFDTHTPFNLGKLLWWCPTARALENPHHGSRWDEYGVKLGGPAPAGLASWAVAEQGGRLLLGSARAAPSLETRPHGPAEADREWCLDVESGAVFHTFEGWERWESPTAAVEAAPPGWILLDGHLVAIGGEVRVCASSGCEDSIRAADVEVPPLDMAMGQAFGPLGEGPFIARVRDGVLVGVTRVVAP